MKKLALSIVLVVSLCISAKAAGHIASTTQTNVTCFNLCDGTINGFATGGVGPYGYAWAGSSSYSASTTNISGLCSGTYTLTVIDSSDMSTATTIATITQPTNLVVNTSSPFLCMGSCVTMNSAVTGGTGGYVYSWVPTSNLSDATNGNPLVCGFIPTTYTLTVTDANGCIQTSFSSVFVDNPGVSTTSTDAHCGACDGTITATAFAGTAPYTFLWTPLSVTAPTATSLCAGSYTINVTDAMGCSTAASAVVNNGTGGVAVVLDTIIHINCSGSSFGTIAVHGTGGTGPYTYLWSPTGGTNDTLTNVMAGTYNVTVTDAGGCNGVGTYTINNFSNLYASVSTVAANCGNLGSATITATGAHPPYSYQWNDPLNQTTSTATNLTGGTYTIVVTDSIGCQLTGYASIGSGCYAIVKGRVYADSNQNCIQDALEFGIQGQVVVANPGGYYGMTDANGDYIILTPNLNNNVSVSNYTGYTATCPATGSLNVNFSALGDTLIANDFGMYQNPVAFDLGIHPGWTSGNPGFTKTYWFLYYNNSATSQNALVRFIYDPALVYTGCTSGGVHNAALHKIEWTFPSLAPGSYWDWFTRPQAFFDVPSTLSISSSLATSFEILPIIGDTYPIDNSLIISDPVTGCHDPNSKSVIPQGVGPTGDIYQSDSVLLYTIHFQNNGNDTAHTVVVKDTLSSFLDPASFMAGASDHAYTVELSGQGILTFRFDNIMLPDSIADEPGSNGYFNYRIKVKAGTPIGSVINNTASIYFDFNEAVVTNTTINTIVDPASVYEISSTNDAVKAYPNPFSDKTTFVIQSENLNETYSFEMTDVLGKKVKSMSEITDKTFTISRNGLQNGIYFYKIYTSESLVGIGKVVIK